MTRSKLLAGALSTVVVTLCAPACAFAAISFTPASPQVYDGTSDIDVLSTSESGGTRTFVFRPDGTSIGCASDAVTTSEPYTTKFPIGSGCPGGTFQADMGGPGTAHFVLANLSGSWIADCISGTYSSCRGSGSYAGEESSFDLTLAPTPGGGGVATSSVDQAEQNLGIAFFLALWTMVIMINLIRRR